MQSVSFDVIVDTKQRSSGTSDNFIYQLSASFPAFDRIELIHAQIPLATFNIKDGENTFTFQEAGGTRSSTVEPGNYTAAEFIIALVAALEVPSAEAFTVTYDSKTYSFTIASTDNFYFLFSNPSNYWLARLLGFTLADTGSGVPSANTVTSNRAANLDFPRQINILIEEASQTVFRGKGEYTRTTFLCPLPDGNNSVNIIKGGNGRYMVHLLRKITTAKFSVRLLDMEGNKLPINDVDWSMVVRVYVDHPNPN